MNEKPPKPKISAKKVIIAAVILAVVVLALLLYLIFAGDKLFGGEQSYTEDESAAAIPEMNGNNESEGQNFYYETNAENPIADVKEQESYIRTFRILTVYGENRNIESVTVTKYGEKYKAESDSRVIIYDGETLYISHGAEILKTTQEKSTYFEETGATSLEEIRTMANDKESYKTGFSVSTDGRLIEAVVEDLTHEGLKMEFEISLESGIVLSERSYLNDSVYRTVFTESFDLLSEDELAENIFRIPE